MARNFKNKGDRIKLFAAADRTAGHPASVISVRSAGHFPTIVMGISPSSSPALGEKEY